MPETYFVVVARKAHPSDAKFGTVPKTSCEVVAPIESAEVLKVKSNAGTVAEAQELARLAYPEHVTQTPIVVTEAAWKES
jgi:hypothetical protein